MPRGSNRLESPTEASIANHEWSEYRRLVLAELIRLDAEIKSNASSIKDNTTNVTILKTKAAMWGLIAGVIAGIISSVVSALVIGLLT